MFFAHTLGTFPCWQVSRQLVERHQQNTHLDLSVSTVAAAWAANLSRLWAISVAGEGEMVSLLGRRVRW
jgi:hypothetical protein